jgi:hypothetical protein
MRFIDAENNPIGGMAELSHTGSDTLIALTLRNDGELDHRSLDPGEYIAVVKNADGRVIFGPNRITVNLKDSLVRLTTRGQP